MMENSILMFIIQTRKAIKEIDKFYFDFVKLKHLYIMTQ